MQPKLWPQGDPRDLARAIVADPRYTGITSATKPEPTVWDRVLAWIGERLGDIFGAIGHVLGAKTPWNVLIGALVIATLVLAVAYLIFRLGIRFATARTAPRTSPSHGALAGERSAADLRAAALAAAQAGRYRDAAGLLFVSALRALDEAGRIAYDPARPAGEFGRLVRDPVFAALAGEAVVALFGAAEPRADTFERMTGTYDRFFERAQRA
ncbi:MAG: hypothetical protein NVSMB64_08810 [Candidatus Velthaea sp.]